MKQWKLNKAQLVELGKDIQVTYAIDLILREHNNEFSTEHRILRLPPYHSFISPVEIIWGKCKFVVRRCNGNTDNGQANKQYWLDSFISIDGGQHWKKAFDKFDSNVQILKQADEEYYSLQNQLESNELNRELVIENDENVNYFDVNVANNVLV